MKFKQTFLIAAAALVFGLAGSHAVKADWYGHDRDGYGGRQGDWHDHNDYDDHDDHYYHDDHDWRGGGYYGPPPVYYAPPPRYYAPPVYFAPPVITFGFRD